MDNNKHNMMEFKVWNRKILNAFWIVSLIYIIGQVLFLVLDVIDDPTYSIRRFLIKYMLIPDSIMLLILVSSELFFKHFKKYEKYLALLCSIAIAYTAFFNISPRIPGRQTVLIIPILISIFYFSKRVLMLTCLVNSLVLWMVFIVSPYQREIMSIYELIIVTFSFISAVIVGIGVVNRGTELLNSITALVKNEEKLIVEKSIMDKLSKTDALTGLYNHKTFHEYVDTILTQNKLYSFQIQLAIIDIDNFKIVNDTHGHWTGDIVLKEVGKILQSSVTADDFVTRYGGEEFAVVFIGKTFPETLNLLEKIRKSIENRTFVELGSKSVTVSIGVHNYLSSDGKELLFKYADEALYKAKRSGKNKVVIGP